MSPCRRPSPTGGFFALDVASEKPEHASAAVVVKGSGRVHVERGEGSGRALALALVCCCFALFVCGRLCFDGYRDHSEYLGSLF